MIRSREVQGEKERNFIVFHLTLFDVVWQLTTKWIMPNMLYTTLNPLMHALLLLAD